LLASCTSPTPPRVSNAPVDAAFLTIAGRAFTFQGQTVVLRGINIDNGGATYEAGEYNEREAIDLGKKLRKNITEDESDYARLDSWGINCVRFGLDWHWYAGDKDQFFAVMDQHIQWAKAHHMWLIPVMFVPRGGYQDFSEGTRFWKEHSYRDSLKKFWVEYARRYANEPTIAGYDLLNEPSSGQVGVDWWPYAGELRDAIYAVDKNHFVVIESHDDGQFWERLPLKSSTKYANVVYSVHGYDPESMTHNGVFGPAADLTYPGKAPDGEGVVKYWDKATLDRHLRVEGRMPITWAQEANVPLLIGEWGTVKRTKGYLRYIADNIDLMESWGAHWTLFAYREYDPVTDFGIYSAPSGMTKDAKADLAMIEVLKKGLRANVRPR
jgi:hypothetical protein